MQQMIKKILFAFCSLSVILNCLHASTLEDRKKSQMIQDLEVIKHHFEVAYAPAEWKKEYAGWEINEAFEQSKNQILALPAITTKQFQQIVRDFVKSMKDYHVDVLFFSTEEASLPFSVKGIQGKYFVDWVDPIRLSASCYGIRPGDELLEFDERPIEEVIKDLIEESGKGSNLNTDQALAAMKLTMRAGMAGDRVPQGPVLVTTRSVKTGKIITQQIRWSYTPEHIKNPLDFLQHLDCISAFLPGMKENQPKIEIPKILMANPLHQAFAQKYTERDGGLGSRKSFLPMLGKALWSIDDMSSEDRTSWHAYIYRHPQGHNIGYIRIPHYVGNLEDIKDFGNILNMMEEHTEALVIDQLHNFGGFVHMQYALAAMLTNQPLKAPYHRIKITQKEVLEAYQTLEFIKIIELILDGTGSMDSSDPEDKDKEYETQEDADAEEALQYQEILFIKAYCELILEEWNKGHTLTCPTPILGVDRINPNPQVHYSKPILMLIDEMDFSGGDFMPAIMQDNDRAVLFGTRTAGAGGYVFGFQFPNTHGIAKCYYTASIAERASLQKIENLGVTPDIEYQITLEDVQGGYQGYIDAVNQALQTLLEHPSK